HRAHRACHRRRLGPPQRTSYRDGRGQGHRQEHRPADGDRHLDAAGRTAVTASTAPAVAPVRTRVASDALVLTILSAAAFVASLDLFIVNVAIPQIGSDFAGSSLSDLSWVLSGYAVLYAALLVPLGRLADRFGR